MAKTDGLPCMGIQRKFHIPRQILTEVQHGTAVLRPKQRARKTLLLTDGRAHGLRQQPAVQLSHAHPVPARDLSSPVTGLPLLHIILPDRAVGRSLPALVGSTDDFTLLLQLTEKSQPFPVEKPVSVHAAAAAIPAVPQHHQQLVFPLL